MTPLSLRLALGLAGLLAAGTLAAAEPAPRIDLPVAAVAKSLQVHPASERPVRYAVPVDLALSLAQGSWTTAPDASALWQLRLHSQDARSLGLRFSNLELPAGATLTVTGATAHYGPYVHGGELWVPPLGGDEILLQIAAPADRAAAVQLGPVTAYHGFASWTSEVAPKTAGSCNIDITCSEASAWTQDAGSVARITVGNQFFCSGQLVNNVRQDRRRLFLTANHCGIDGNGGTAESVAFYFDYTGPCDSAGTDPAPAATFQGSRKLAGDVQADFTLVLITDDRPLPADVYFAGWDASGTGANSGASIHHPDGDEKKISLYDTPAVQDTADIGSGCPIDAWRVKWSSGTTEGGSSGGGLWNSNHRLIGQLSGGPASCDNPNGFDFFGRMDRAWTANARSDGQLKAHLDPDNTCIAEAPGLNGTSAAAPLQADDPTLQHKCSGTASTCSGSPGSSSPTGAVGPLPPAALLVLLLGALARRRRA